MNPKLEAPSSKNRSNKEMEVEVVPLKTNWTLRVVGKMINSYNMLEMKVNQKSSLELIKKNLKLKSPKRMKELIARIQEIWGLFLQLILFREMER